MHQLETQPNNSIDFEPGHLPNNLASLWDIGALNPIIAAKLFLNELGNLPEDQKPHSERELIKILETKLAEVGIFLPRANLAESVLAEQLETLSPDLRQEVLQTWTKCLDQGVDTRNTPRSWVELEAQIQAGQEKPELPGGLPDSLSKEAKALRQALAKVLPTGSDPYVDGLTQGNFLTKEKEEAILLNLAQLTFPAIFAHFDHNQPLNEQQVQCLQKIREKHQKFLDNLIPLLLGVDSTTGNSLNLNSQVFKNTLAWLQLSMRLERLENPQQRKQAAKFLFDVLRDETALYRQNGRSFAQSFAISGTHGVYPAGFAGGLAIGVMGQVVEAGSTVKDAAEGTALGGGLAEYANQDGVKNTTPHLELNTIPYRKKDGEALSFAEFSRLHLDTLVKGLERCLKLEIPEGLPAPVYSHVIAIPPKGGLIYKDIETLISYFNLEKLLASEQLTSAQKEIVAQFLERQGQIMLVLDVAQERWLVNPERILETCEQNNISAVLMSTFSKAIGGLKLGGVFYYTDQAIAILRDKIQYASQEELTLLYRYFGIGFLPDDLEKLLVAKLQEAGLADDLAVNFNVLAKELGVAKKYNEFHHLPEGYLQAGIDWLRSLTRKQLAKQQQIKLMDDNNPDLVPSMTLSFLIKGTDGKAFSDTELKRIRALLRAGTSLKNGQLQFNDSKIFTGNPFIDITAESEADEAGNLRVAVNKGKKHPSMLRFGPKIELVQLITELLMKRKEILAESLIENRDGFQVSHRLLDVEYKLLMITQLWQENCRRLMETVSNFREMERQLYHNSVEKKMLQSFGKIYTKTDIMALPLDELEKLNQFMGQFNPQEILDWAVKLDPGNVYLMTSAQPNSGFALSAIAEISQKTELKVPVVFGDTGNHFPEVLAYLDQVAEVLNLDIIKVKSPLVEKLEAIFSFPQSQYEFWPDSADQEEIATNKQVFNKMCCGLRKVLALAEWTLDLDSPPVMLSSLRGRAGNQVLKLKDGQLHVHPWIAATKEYMDAEKQRLAAVYHLPEHGLKETHASVGCEQCTKPGKNRAECRGDENYECGMHLDGPKLVESVKLYQEQFIDYMNYVWQNQANPVEPAKQAVLIGQVRQVFAEYLPELEKKATVVVNLAQIGFVLTL